MIFILVDALSPNVSLLFSVSEDDRMALSRFLGYDLY